MTPSASRLRKESLLVVATLSLASLCCVVHAELPSASGVEEGAEHVTNHALFLQEYSALDDEDEDAIDLITTESELPDVTSLGLHDIEQRFETLLLGLENIEGNLLGLENIEGKEHSARHERGLKPKNQQAAAKQGPKGVKQVQVKVKGATAKGPKGKKGGKNGGKKGKNKGKQVTAPTAAPTPTAPTPTAPSGPTPTAPSGPSRPTPSAPSGPTPAPIMRPTPAPIVRPTPAPRTPSAPAAPGARRKRRRLHRRVHKKMNFL